MTEYFSLGSESHSGCFLTLQYKIIFICILKDYFVLQIWYLLTKFRWWVLTNYKVHESLSNMANKKKGMAFGGASVICFGDLKQVKIKYNQKFVYI